MADLETSIDGLGQSALRVKAERDALFEALRPFGKLGSIILAEAPPEAKTIVMFTSASGEKFSMQLDYFRKATALTA
jgi:hypothetical protein